MSRSSSITSSTSGQTLPDEGGSSLLHRSRLTSVSSITTTKSTSAVSSRSVSSARSPYFRPAASSGKQPGRQPEAECIKVAVRCRPMSEKEIADGHEPIIEFACERNEIIIHNPNLEPSNLLGTRKSARRNHSKVFKFDAVFDWSSKQDDIYNQVCHPIVDSVLHGFNGTIFAYGQTGTGKTYTMEGLASQLTRRKSLSGIQDGKERVDGGGDSDQLKGIIPKAFEQIFKHIAANPGTQYLVRSSYLEIYQEEIRDLLSKDQTKRLELHEHPEVGVFVKDLTSFVCKSIKEIERVMSVGNQNRTVGATDMNEHSSRSHAIFMITIEQQQPRPQSEVVIDSRPGLASKPNNRLLIKAGKLNLVDLAGSERQRKTNSLGQRQKEAIKINLSLSALGNVINSLMAANGGTSISSSSQQTASSYIIDPMSTHTPYRDSKLTRLLQDSLGGNAKTLMLANIGPASYNYDETINTLSYASRAKCIQNRPKVNEDPKDALLREFQREIETLKAKLEAIKNKSKLLTRSDEPAPAPPAPPPPGGPSFEQRVNGDTNEFNGTNDSNHNPGHNKRRSSDYDRIQLAEATRHQQSDISDNDSEQYKELQSLKYKLKSLEGKLLNSNDADCCCYYGASSTTSTNPTIANQQAPTTRDGDASSIANLREAEATTLIEGYTNKQEFELEKRRQQLANHKEIEQDIKLRLSKQEELELETKQTFSSLQQELDIKTTKLQKLESQIEMIKREIQKSQDTNRLELDELDQVQSVLLKELKLKYLIMNNFIPKQYTDRLFKEQRLVYNDMDNTCHLRGLKSTTTTNNVIVDETSGQPVAPSQESIEPLPRYIGGLRARSKFEKVGETIGSNIRYRYENILEPKLMVPRCTLRSYEAPLVSPKIQAALDGALATQEKDIFI